MWRAVWRAAGPLHPRRYLSSTGVGAIDYKNQ